MKILFVGLATLVLLLQAKAVAAAAADGQQWSATSNTAMSITGDIRFQPTRITFANGATLTLTEPTKAPAFHDDTTQVNAVIYRVRPAANPKLLAGNRLCAGSPVTFVVVWAAPALLGGDAARQMAVYSGPRPPTDTNDAALCGTFLYALGP